MPKLSDIRAWPRFDPRYYQIGALLGLFLFGLLRLHFEIHPAHAIAILVTVLTAQWLFTLAWKLPAFDPKSALISGLSLCLLLRTNSLFLALLTAFAAIAGKFLFRWNGKHIFNPTNFGIVLMILLTEKGVWVSPGQWGNFALFGFFVVCLGGLVVNRASRADVTLTFLAAWLGVLFGRSAWLGEPMTIPLHRLHNGALLIFSFFMISDPKTTPDSRTGRILFAILVATGAWYVQFKLFRTNGLLWSLALFSLTVPIIDRLLPARRYTWGPPPATPIAEKETVTVKGNRYEPLHA